MKKKLLKKPIEEPKALNPITEKILEYKDNTYAFIQSKLIPTIPSNTIVGLMVPQMKKIAKEAFGDGTALTDKNSNLSVFLNTLPHTYYEENMVHFYIISQINDFELCITTLEKFLPYMDCWPVSDQSTPKVFKRNPKKLLPFAQSWILSTHTYVARFGIRMLMNEFLDKNFKPEYLKWVASVDKTCYSGDVYLKKMVAWYFATALAKQYEATIPYIERHKLTLWTHCTTIKKAVESTRIPEEHKEYIKSFYSPFIKRKI